MDLRDYRRALGAFPTGVTIVAALDREGAPWGVTANSFTSVSLDPPLISVCIAKQGRTYQTFTGADTFAVNILAASQQDLALHFSGKTENRFTGIPWEARAGGAPVLPDVAAWLDCTVHARIDAGNHQIMMGRVLRYGHADVAPLTFCRGQFFPAAPMETVP